MQSVSGGAPSARNVTDWLELRLRAYSEPANASPKRRERPYRPRPSDWVLVFDCETTTTPDQRLRFGAYQLRHRGRLKERGVFYDRAGLAADEISTLQTFILAERPTDAGERLFIRTREEFVERVLFRRAFKVGAQIVGFNLPFDISRLAVGHGEATRDMKGGFSFDLSGSRYQPNIAVKHLSARAALFRFRGAKVGSTKADKRPPTDRGYFVDVKTLAATLTSASHSLEGLSAHLDIETPKRASEDHDAPLAADYIRYCLTDVQATWECFEKLAARVASFNLPGVGLYDLFSEASLGKAYLRAMGVRPWREVQPDFPRPLLGQIMSAYFGGRAEVHIRREIVEVIHCDFKSMYPTVCTLMGLWSFVTARGVTWSDATADVRDLVAVATPESMRSPEAWKGLTTLVQVKPDFDVLPVRACYGDSPNPNIGLNHLSANEPLWFTLADVLASKMLTGEAPGIVQAVRYAPGPQESGLTSIEVAGERFDPKAGDFYRDLIDHRTDVQARAEMHGPEQARLKAEELAIKILANSTSYGIFMELNVEDRAKAGPMRAYSARPRSIDYRSETVETPGPYFHPLLATLITGAARLMLALAECQVIERGLDWAFCDTDSIAIANTAGLPRETFEAGAMAVQDWFAALNPYQRPGPILKVERVNYPESGGPAIQPLYCLAVSAKRYVLFNRDADGAPVVRKASGHGLGHLMDPYNDPRAITAEWIKRVGAPRWQADLWSQIVLATDRGTPDVVAYAKLAGFDGIARSQYAATTPALLKWFDGRNRGKPYALQVRPFNFLLSLQLRSDIDLAASDLDALRDRGRANAPSPAAPYTRSATAAEINAFDRKTGAPIAPELLKSLGRSLVRYHLHSEAKFLNGEDDRIGLLGRRHVQAVAIQPVGKETDDIEERTFLGEGNSEITFPMGASEVDRVLDYVWSQQTALGISDRDLEAEAKISHHTLAKLRVSGGRAKDAGRLLRAVEAYRKRGCETDSSVADILHQANDISARLGGAAALARQLGMTRQYIGRVLKGERPISDAIARKIRRLAAS